MATNYFQRFQNAIKGDNPLWLTVYSDLMTNLMLFFLMLYGVTRMATAAQPQILDVIQSEFLKDGKTAVQYKTAEVIQTHKENELAQILGQFADGSPISTLDINESRLRITLSSPALFPSGGTTLSPELKQELNKLAIGLRYIENPVVVEGHTDNIPPTTVDYSTNWELSIARSEKVIRYLIEESSLSSSRFIAAGFGEHRPVASNDSNDGRAKNRRIEISIMKEYRGDADSR